jgi:hypothetical protein
MEMVEEVRRQFREIPGLLEGTGKAEYEKCVEISTKAALKEMLAPGLITIITPILVGFIMGPEALGGYMAGVTVSGVMWAIFQSNAGGAWDNAKKSFEKGVEINGQMYYKGSDPHKAAVTGDTVGDPFKDTSGPSMNILIKLTCLVGLAIAPILGNHGVGGSTSKDNIRMEIRENRLPPGMTVPPSMGQQSGQPGVQQPQMGQPAGSNAAGGATLRSPNGQVPPKTAGGVNGISKTPSPEQMEQMKKMMEERRKQGGNPTVPQQKN